MSDKVQRVALYLYVDLGNFWNQPVAFSGGLTLLSSLIAEEGKGRTAAASFILLLKSRCKSLGELPEGYKVKGNSVSELKDIKT